MFLLLGTVTQPLDILEYSYAIIHAYPINVQQGYFSAEDTSS